MKNLIKIFAVVLMVSGCASESEIKSQLSDAVRKRAAFDFNCPAENLQLEQTTYVDFHLIQGEYQVKGCESRQSYNATYLDKNQTSVIAIGSPGDNKGKTSK